MPTYVTDRGTIQVPDGWTLEQFWALANPPGTPLPRVLGSQPTTSALPPPVYPGTTLPATPGVPYDGGAQRGSWLPLLAIGGLALLAVLLVRPGALRRKRR